MTASAPGSRPDRVPQGPWAAGHVDGDSPGIVDLLGRLSDQFTTLLRQELELAKTEAKQEARTAARAGAGFGMAGLTGHMTLLFLSLAAAWGLAELVAPGIAFTIVGVVYALVTALLFSRAKKQADRLAPDLPETRASIRNDLDLAKDTP